MKTFYFPLSIISHKFITDPSRSTKKFALDVLDAKGVTNRYPAKLQQNEIGLKLWLKGEKEPLVFQPSTEPHKVDLPNTINYVIRLKYIELENIHEWWVTEQ
jgi:hypothetical protein